jgi:DNA-binding NtrC family response regulator
METVIAEESRISVGAMQEIDHQKFSPQARPYERVRGDEHQHIREAMALSRGNKTAAARMLGMSARQLYYRLQKLDIPM